MTLKSIEEYNNEVLRLHNIKHATGVACPNCSSELKYSSDALLLSYPAQRRVKCYTCGFETKLLAT